MQLHAPIAGKLHVLLRNMMFQRCQLQHAYGAVFVTVAVLAYLEKSITGT